MYRTRTSFRASERIIGSALLIAAALVAPTSCGGSSESGSGAPRCVPGESRFCAGEGACQGFQVCNDTGTAFGACACADAGSAGTGGSVASGGAAGSGGAGNAAGNGATSGFGGTAGTSGFGGTSGSAGASGFGGSAGMAGGAGVSGFGGSAGSGTGGGSGAAAALGRSCSLGTQCAGLTCLTAGSGALAGEGPARGYCTRTCTADTDCQALDPASACVDFGDPSAPASYCVRGCSFGPENLQSFDPNKCHGRQDVSCFPLSDGGATVPVCIPQCGSDTQCGAGLFCNPQTGMCTSTQPTGKPAGAACTPPGDGGMEECNGFCDEDYGCIEPCVSGAIVGCGWDGPMSGTADAWCWFQSTSSEGIGDLGFCAEMCDCDDDCGNPRNVCNPLNDSQLEQAFGRKGICSLRDLPDGGMNAGLPCPGTGGGAGVSGN